MSKPTPETLEDALFSGDSPFDVCRFCGWHLFSGHSPNCIGRAHADAWKKCEAERDALMLFKTVLEWMADEMPETVNRYVQGHHALDPIYDLPAFFSGIPKADIYGWMAKHGSVASEARRKLEKSP
jgi:hypothetical protein